MPDQQIDPRGPLGPGGAGLEALRRGWKWLMAIGILWIVLGSAAILMPLAATLALDYFFGALFVIGGLAQLIQATRTRGWKGFLLNAVSGLLALLVGVALLLFPAQGVMSLALLLGVFFLIEGTVKTMAALQIRPAEGWGWMLVSGLLGLLVGILIFAEYPTGAVWMLGLLVGIQLIFSGWSMVFMAMAARRQ